MAQVTSYTTTEAIRASLGIDSADCPDSAILDSNMELELTVDLDDWLPTHPTIFSDGNASAATEEEKKLRNYLVLYAQWYGAKEMASRFLLVPQIVTDGKAQMNRFSKLDLQKVADNAALRMAKYKTALDEEVNGATQDTVTLLSVSVPDYDPVTNV